RAARSRAPAPAPLAQPDEVYYGHSPDVLTRASPPREDLPATSDPEVGALVMVARASVDRRSFGKLVGPGARLEPVTVNGGSGFWISGAPHGFFFYTTGGNLDPVRLARVVLILDPAGLGGGQGVAPGGAKGAGRGGNNALRAGVWLAGGCAHDAVFTGCRGPDIGRRVRLRPRSGQTGKRPPAGEDHAAGRRGWPG